MVQLTLSPALDSVLSSAIIFPLFHNIVFTSELCIDKCNDVSRWSLREVVVEYLSHYSGICLRG